jgi:Tfp pilus assembly protein PilP
MTMKLAKAAANIMAVLAISLCLVPGVWAQAKPATKAAPKAKPATVAPKKAAAPKAAPPAKKAAAAAEPAAAAAPAEAPATDKTEALLNKRDPFVPLINDKKDKGGQHLPPGKAGLVIATVRVDGAVRAASGMIAVVSNPEESVYFIREGDRLYDGAVEKIGLDGVTFRENSKDAFGKPVERVVTKRIYATAGEQQ